MNHSNPPSAPGPGDPLYEELQALNLEVDQLRQIVSARERERDEAVQALVQERKRFDKERQELRRALSSSHGLDDEHRREMDEVMQRQVEEEIRHKNERELLKEEIAKLRQQVLDQEAFRLVNRNLERSLAELEKERQRLEEELQALRSPGAAPRAEPIETKAAPAVAPKPAPQPAPVAAQKPAAAAPAPMTESPKSPAAAPAATQPPVAAAELGPVAKAETKTTMTSLPAPVIPKVAPRSSTLETVGDRDVPAKTKAPPSPPPAAEPKPPQAPPTPATPAAPTPESAGAEVDSWPEMPLQGTPAPPEPVDSWPDLAVPASATSAPSPPTASEPSKPPEAPAPSTVKAEAGARGAPLKRPAAAPPVAPRQERRRWPRRAGNPTPVEISLPETAEPLEGWVVDRSTGGLGLLVDQEIPLGTALKVCAPRSPDADWVHVKVIYCRADRSSFRLGCQFTKSYDWLRLRQFG